MRLVVSPSYGQLSLNCNWLPMWIGMNVQLKKELDKEIRAKAVGRPMTEETLDEINEVALSAICARFPMLEGLRDYLDGLKYVTLPENSDAKDREDEPSPAAGARKEHP